MNKRCYLLILINKAIAKILSNSGYNLVKKTKIKRLSITDYSQAIYSRGEIYFEVDIDKTCNFNQFFFGLSGWHYFTKMAKEIINNEKVKYKGSILEEFYTKFQPVTFQELYFTTRIPIIDGDRDQTFLSENLNKYKYDLWSSVRQKVEMKKVHEYGLLRLHGTQHFGPVSEMKGELELQRLKNTYYSIFSKGHLPDKFGFISGYFLKFKNDYRFIILDGNHRTAVLSAMGYDEIPVIFQSGFPRVIDYNDLENLPHIKSGLLSEKLAKQIFLSYFEKNGSINKAKKLGLLEKIGDEI